MIAQLYKDQPLCRVFDARGDMAADLPLVKNPTLTKPQQGSRALAKIGLVRIGGWDRTPWGWQIDVQIRE